MTALGDGVAAVAGQVEQHQFELAAIQVDRRRRRRQGAAQHDACFQQLPQHRLQRLDGGRGVEILGLLAIAAAEAQQPANDGHAAPRRFLHRRQAIFQQRDARAVAAGVVVVARGGEADDHRQHVVEIVRQAASHALDDLALLRMDQLRLRAFARQHFLLQAMAARIGFAQALAQCFGGAIQQQGHQQIAEQHRRQVVERTRRLVDEFQQRIVAHAQAQHQQQRAEGDPQRAAPEHQPGQDQHQHLRQLIRQLPLQAVDRGIDQQRRQHRGQQQADAPAQRAAAHAHEADGGAHRDQQAHRQRHHQARRHRTAPQLRPGERHRDRERGRDGDRQEQQQQLDHAHVAPVHLVHDRRPIEPIQ